MRLLFVSHSFPPAGRELANLGGMQRVAIELDAAFRRDAELEYRARILRSSWGMVHWRTPPFLVGTAFALRGLMARQQLDVVLFSSMVTASLAVPLRSAARRAGVRTAAIVHGLDVTTPFGPYQRFVPRVFEALDLVLPVSGATAAACTERGLSAIKVRTVGNGIDVGRFAPKPTDLRARRALLAEAFGGSVPGHDGFVLVSVGRHVRRKGFEWFVREVLPRLPDSCHYWLAGSGPESSSIEAAVHEYGLQARVRLLGRVSESQLEALYGGGDVFVMPNVRVPGDMEGFGVVMLEAALGGLPTVGARLEGIAEVVSDGENGRLVESGDAEGFAEAIRAWHDDRFGLERDRERAAAYTRRRFGWETVAAEYRTALQEISGR